MVDEIPFIRCGGMGTNARGRSDFDLHLKVP